MRMILYIILSQVFYFDMIWSNAIRENSVSMLGPLLLTGFMDNYGVDKKLHPIFLYGRSNLFML